ASALHGTDKAVDDSLSRWGRWRDREFAEHYWFANDLGAAGPLPAVVREVLARLRAQGKAELALEINNHRLRPSQLLTPGRLLGATGRALLHERGRRLDVLHEVGDLVAREVHRRRLRWRPEHAPADAADSGIEPAAAKGSRVVRARRRELVGGGY